MKNQICIFTISILISGCMSPPDLPHQPKTPITKQEPKLLQYSIPSKTVVTDAGNLEFTDFVLTFKRDGESRMKQLSGGVVNNHTQATVASLSFFIVVKDASGKRISFPMVCVDEIPKGGYESMVQKKTSNYLHPLSELQIESVIPSYSLKYDTTLLNPGSNGLRYSDKSIAIEFNEINERTKQVEFTLENLSNKIIQIDWDTVSIVDLSGTAFRVIHKGIRISERDTTQPTTTIPPYSKITDLLVPVKNAYYKETPSWMSSEVRDALARSHGWQFKPLLDQSGQRLADKSGELQIHIPMKMGDKEKAYTFKFKVIARY